MSSADSRYGYNFNSIVPHPDVAPLRCRSAESGYRNVYLHRYRDQMRDAGAPRFVAKVKMNGVLQRIKGSAGPCAHVVALHVVCWYRDRFGERWREAIRGRHLCPKKHRPRSDEELSPVRAVESKALGGWRADVYEFGAPVAVAGRRKAGHRADPVDAPGNCLVGKGPRLLVFPDKAGAEWAARRWVYERYGLFAPLCVWRG